MCSVSPDSGVTPRSAPYNACLDCLCLALMGRCNTRHPSAALDHPLSAVTDRPAVRASRLLQSVGVYRRGWREARRLDLTNTLIFVFNRRGQKKEIESGRVQFSKSERSEAVTQEHEVKKNSMSRLLPRAFSLSASCRTCAHRLARAPVEVSRVLHAKPHRTGWL